MDLYVDRGLKLKLGDRVLSLDSGGKADCYFISHAHSDHVLSRKKAKVFCSKETASLIVHRYEKAFDFVYGTPFKAELLDSGHILGSKALYIANGYSLLYTGDFSTQRRAFMKPAKFKKADTLVIESTFGSPLYVFPNQEEELGRLKDWVQDTLRNHSVLVMAYSLGKAQVVSKALEDFDVYVHSSVSRMNEVYNHHGISLNTKEFDINNPPSGNFVYILPPSLSGTIGRGLKKKFGMKSAICSGWAVNPMYKFMFGADESFVISDHADFEGLVETVKKVSPSKVYTVHGFSDEFAAFLKRKGYDAEALE